MSLVSDLQEEVTRLQAACADNFKQAQENAIERDKVNAHRAEVMDERDALKAEVDRLKSQLADSDHCYRQAHNSGVTAIRELEAAQSELTKARELLTQGAYFGPGIWSKQVLEFLAHQFAPAAKGGE